MRNLVLGTSSFDGLDLRTLVDVNKIQRIQDDFAEDTGLALITVDSVGTPVTEASRFSPLCQFLRQDPEIRRRCFSCDAHGGFQSAISGKPFVYQCHAGLVDFSVAIMWGQRYLGAVMAGQVFLNRGQEELERLISSGASLKDDARLAHFYQDIKVVAPSKLMAAADRVAKLVNESLSASTSRLVDLAGDTYPSLGAGRSGKPVPTAATAIPLIPLAQSEPKRIDVAKLAANVEKRNIAGNLEILGEYLDDLFPGWSRKIDRSKLAEFEDALMSIAAGQALHLGRDISQVVIQHRNQRRTPMNRYASQLYCERLLIQFHNLLEPAMERDERSVTTLLNEIEKDPTGFLTLQKAADYLMWSPSHFSREFKKHTGQSFVKYVTEKRIERAKFVLEHTTKPVMRIAGELKFHPLNYFSRTFRKLVGMTPSEYRDSVKKEEQ